MKGLRRGVLAVSLAAVLAGCGVLNDPRGFTDAVMKSPLLDDDSSEKAMSALTRGEYSTAERLAIEALRRNPKDPYALYTAGMVYQATGRYDLARQYYEVIIANRPQVTLTTPSQGGPQVRSLIDVAQANLLVVDKLLGRTVAGSALRSGRGTDMTPQTFEPMVPQGVSRGAVAAEPLGEPGQAMPASMMSTRGATQAETNVATRFRTLRRLLDEGLITPEEHARRRNTNLGALLPYSSSLPPAQGLERPGPTEEQVVDRLRALGVALESRALSPAEHGAERLAILDALLPAEPRRVEMPILPPKDVMEAATAVGRVERLRAANLVSTEEAKREKAAVEKVLDSQLAKQPVSGTAAGLRQATANGNGAKSPSGGGTPGIGLGTAKTEDAARDTWTRIKAKFPEELASIDASFPKVDQGERGTRWRIVAGPMKSRSDAVKLCKVLKLHRQACEATSY
ncbi:tetratricopeptide repeat protein [Magnetospirillum sp. 15-1]|uniref:SPOR domain-containing protein n=1 Tax=Magnetospirillum sp. 15-1 TaxID=1979370 RepID=UPI001F5B8844|nr:tetratricopeptide repeat protein [Magnetospirillum sp. 15-1]